MIRRFAVVPAAVALCSSLWVASPRADTVDPPTAENADARSWFQDARFGLFIHWGVYSIFGEGEWVLEKRQMRLTDYERVAGIFNPTEFNAAEWVGMAKAAGMKYITITSKHHDGFAMFDSKLTTWDIVDHTPFKKDPLKLLADECRRQGLKLFFYYSQVDWHHPDYFPRGRFGNATGRPDSGDWSHYLDYMDGQLTELLTRYGRLGGIWLDGSLYDKRDADWRLPRTYNLIHRLQPQALVASNHVHKPGKTYPGEDIQATERDIPGFNTTGDPDYDNLMSDKPLEICDTINHAWGFKTADTKMKSAKELLQFLVRVAGWGGNFLLNVGPMPNGKIQPEFVERLTAVGRWLKTNGESVYGTRKGPFDPRPWGAATRKGNTVYVHVLDWPDSTLAIPAVGKVKRARALKGGIPVDVQEAPGGANDGLIIKIPHAALDDYDTVIALDVER